MDETLAMKRKLFETLSVEQLEELARDSEALLAKARENGTASARS
jgi:hypothetical protein